MINAKLRKLMFGTSLPQEYICVAKEKLSNQSHAFLFSDNGFIDITNEHIFLGYSPVIIGISSAKAEALNDLLNDRNETVID